MEEEENNGGGFNDRVNKVFGSISKSSSWSLSGAQIERRVWRHPDPDDETTTTTTSRRDDDRIPLSSSSFNNEDHDIIGLDSTLDNEEEEDAFDKMAQGTHHDHRLFMNDVTLTQHGPYFNSSNLSLLHPPPTNYDQPMFNVQPPPDVGFRIKSILKRKTDDFPKPSKRVRFHPTCHPQVSSLPQVSQHQHQHQHQHRTLPDYIQNPSKYTLYHLLTKPSNIDPYLNFLDQVKKSKHVVGADDNSSALLPKSPVFIPRKKHTDTPPRNSVNQQPSTGINAIGIADLEVQQQQSSEITQHHSHVSTKPRFQMPGRRYRSKMEEDDTLS